MLTSVCKTIWQYFNANKERHKIPNLCTVPILNSQNTTAKIRPRVVTVENGGLLVCQSKQVRGVCETGIIMMSKHFDWLLD